MNTDYIYGAVTGAIIAMTAGLLASALTNRAAKKRQILDLAHEAKERELDRNCRLKREVYIPFVEAASEAVSFMMQAATVPFEALIAAENPITRFTRQVAKLNLIAPREVYEPVNLGGAGLAKCFGLLVSDRLAIHKTATQLGFIDSSIERFLTEQKDLTKRFEAAAGDQASTNTLLGTAGYIGQELEKLFEQKLSLTLQKSDMEFELMKRATTEIKPLRDQSLISLIAIRRELNLGIDETWLSDFQKKITMDLDEWITAFQTDTQKKVREMLAGAPKKLPTPLVKIRDQ